jgi:hypothetical protein
MVSPELFRKQLAKRRRTLSMAKIAEELGVTRQAVYLWLDGTNEPPSTVRLLAEKLWSRK